MKFQICGYHPSVVYSLSVLEGGNRASSASVAVTPRPSSETITIGRQVSDSICVFSNPSQASLRYRFLCGYYQSTTQCESEDATAAAFKGNACASHSLELIRGTFDFKRAISLGRSLLLTYKWKMDSWLEKHERVSLFMAYVPPPETTVISTG